MSTTVVVGVLGVLLGVVVGWLVRGRAGGGDVLGPVHDTLDRLAAEMQRVERARISADAGLAQQLDGMRSASSELGAQARRLASALHTPHLRGRWGEVHLRAAVEAAGLSRHCDFTPQQRTASGQRPDLVVHLPGGHDVAVDAKVPLHAYLDAAATDDPELEAALMVDHARALKAHVVALSSKSYWQEIRRSPQYVVLFVPSDAILEAACRADPDLLEFAFGRDIVPATPSTLIALLRTVALTWREDAVARDAEEIHRLGRELHHRVATMADHFHRVGVSLGSAVTAYNSTVASMQSRVLVTARALGELDAYAGTEGVAPDRPAPVETAVRAVTPPM
ncbi:DNA recombination protein RmuC [Williamsia deligens]|uniref:DNA recombination protein RmuC n=1 Tax=Williamsia deligens TaxID=321325 RepID=A0ABW3G0W6_9NOCA|nr:DNA recombination protein RmuC [Williamsia deligens]